MFGIFIGVLFVVAMIAAFVGGYWIASRTPPDTTREDGLARKSWEQAKQILTLEGQVLEAHAAARASSTALSHHLLIECMGTKKGDLRRLSDGSVEMTADRFQWLEERM